MKKLLIYRRIFSIALVLIIFTVIAVSHAYVVLNADHECAGEECAVCESIKCCREELRIVSSILTFVETAFVIPVIFRDFSVNNKPTVAAFSPILACVKLTE